MSYFLNIYPVIGSERTDQLQATEEKKKKFLKHQHPCKGTYHIHCVSYVSHKYSFWTTLRHLELCHSMSDPRGGSFLFICLCFHLATCVPSEIQG